MNLSEINPESFYQGFTEPDRSPDSDEPQTITLLAYHKYLLRCSGGEKDVLAVMIMEDLMEQSPAAFELISHVTKGEITDDTIIKAAELLINSNR
jgi:hypothetical protein